ncbi:MAG: hypothetical protein HOP15_16515 [Planctomycetes bacterium]|nr:hypothetical protein [Planctomycetota bacterium]
MSRSRSRFAWLVVLLAAGSWLVWRLARGERPSETHLAASPEEGVERAQPPAELRLAFEPVAREQLGEIPALAPREQREIVVQLAPTLDLVWCGQIIDGTRRSPMRASSACKVTRSPSTPGRPWR